MIPWCFQVYHPMYFLSSPVVLPHWFCDTDTPSVLQAIALLPLKVGPYITRLDNRSRATRAWGTFLHLLFLWLTFAFYSLLLLFLIFLFHIPVLLSFAHPARLELSFSLPSSHRRYGRVSVTLTSRSAAGHHRYRSRCVESDCCTSPSLCQVCQQQPLSPSGSHCCVTPGRGQCANQEKLTTKKPHQVRCIRTGHWPNRFRNSRHRVI